LSASDESTLVAEAVSG